MNHINDKLICPSCKSQLVFNDEKYVCSGTECDKIYPFHNGVPIIINESNSIFSIDEFLNQKQTTFKKKKGSIYSRIVALVDKVLPTISNNLSSKENFEKIVEILKEKTNPRILIIGGGVITTGTDILLKEEGMEFVESDVSFAPRTQIILDCHDIPYSENSFDCVVLQAVLEHVVDPNQCVSEVLRVLKTNGIIYAATPFMQQVHMRQYDFTRYTYLGHRRLLRSFDEIESGVFAGSGVALAWSIKYFLRSLSNKKVIVNISEIFVRIFFFWLKYIDYLIKDKKGTYEAASGYYFLGINNGKILRDKELLKKYKGFK